MLQPMYDEDEDPMIPRKSLNRDHSPCLGFQRCCGDPWYCCGE